MTSIVHAQGRISDWFNRFFAKPAFSPQSYWESRHQKHSGSLSSVGHAQLSEAANAEQYAIKRVRIAAAIQRYVANPSACELLDAGCGVAALTKLYVELGFRVTGVDFSATAIEAARNLERNAIFVESSLEDLSLARSFDLACVIDVLQHLVNDTAASSAIAAIGRHVKRGGLAVVVDTMNDDGPSAEHCRRRSLSWHEAEFRITGFEIIDRDRFLLPHENATKDLLVLQRRF